jgi:hypothetical protein
MPNTRYSEEALIANYAVAYRGIEEGAQARQVVQYDQRKKIDAEEERCGAGMDKECERTGWEEAHEFLMSTGAWQRW